MSKPMHVQIIEEGRALIADEKNWCRRQMAFDVHGAPICADDDKARKLCAYGALIAAAHRTTKDCSLARRLTANAVRHLGGSDALIRVNDTKGHAAVLARFDGVIQSN